MKTRRFFRIAAVLSAAALLAGCDMEKDGYLFFSGEAFGMGMTGTAGDRFDKTQENPFIKTADEPLSTFSVDADGASYAIMRKALRNERPVPPESVRTEEYLNYFTFDYPGPKEGAALALNAEIGGCPWQEGHRLLRLGLQGEVPKTLPASNYVFLIDVSGSMAFPDKLELLKSGLILLTAHLQPEDRVSILTYSGEVKKLLESTPAGQSDKIRKAVGKLEAGGCTAGGKAMEMAYKEALANYIEGGNNRVIMGTDGDFNVGVTNIEALVEMAGSYAKQGIFLTVCGFGSGNLNDALMEQISNRCNGTYDYIDSEREMVRVFAEEAAKFHSVACDCKIQLAFNPETVESYRLIGYENRMLENEDFTDDRKDAAEIGAGQTITALYEIVPAAGYAEGGRAVTFDVRYKKTTASASLPLSMEVTVPKEEKLSANLSFAAGVAAYSLLLRDSEYKGAATFDMAEALVEGGLSFDPHGYRKELLGLIGMAKREAMKADHRVSFE